MALTDPTGGVGYSWGAQLPSSHMTTVATQQPNAADFVLGGSYTLSSGLTVSGSGIANFGKLQYTTGGVCSVGHDVTWTGTQTPKLATRSYGYNQPIGGNAEHDAYWTYASVVTIGAQTWAQDDVGAVGWITFPFTNLPHHGTLTSVTAYVRGAAQGGAAHSALPAGMPMMTLTHTDFIGSFTSGYASQSDTSADYTAYDAYHTITITGLSESLSIAADDPRSFCLTACGETGAGSQTGFTIYGIIATVSCTEIRP